MIGIDELPDAIQWHEGMLLSPTIFRSCPAGLRICCIIISGN